MNLEQGSGVFTIERIFQHLVHKAQMMTPKIMFLVLLLFQQKRDGKAGCGQVQAGRQAAKQVASYFHLNDRYPGNKHIRGAKWRITKKGAFRSSTRSCGAVSVLVADFVALTDVDLASTEVDLRRRGAWEEQGVVEEEKEEEEDNIKAQCNSEGCGLTSRPTTTPDRRSKSKGCKWPVLGTYAQWPNTIQRRVTFFCGAEILCFFSR